MIQAISFQEGKHILDTYPGSVLLDVRTEDEYALEHAAGAKLLPLDDIEDADLSEILPDKQARILIYWPHRPPGRLLAAAQLFDLGYPHLYDLGGSTAGPTAWNMACYNEQRGQCSAPGCRRVHKKIHSRSKAGRSCGFFSSECHRDLCTLAQGGIQGDCGVVDLGDVLDDGET